MPNRSLTREEAAERAALLDVASYDVELALSPAETFGSRTTIRFTCARPGAASFVELSDAVAAGAVLNGRPVPAGAFQDNRIRLEELAADNVLEVTATLPCVTHGDGMQRTVDPADDEVYLNGYCGMDVAQRIYACFDQADLKATHTLSVTAPPEWTVLGCGRLLDRSDGTHRFATTPRISTYLFTVAAGPWHSRTWEHAGLPFGWHARRSLAPALDRDLDELRRVTEACFDHYTTIFEEPYAFDSYDQVMGPGLNWGAMEFPGCVAFRDEYLFPGGASDGQRELRAMVIAHEMAHMWFGDLVTMRWWEDSWLSESFADYMGFEVAARAAGFPDSWATFTLSSKLGAYVADSRRSTHPVAPSAESVVDTDTAFANFDQITYAKGNSVVRQLATWLGEETFLRGVNGYLSAHRLGNADLADFLAALDAVTERDVAGWAEGWLRRSGFDTLHASYDDGVPTLRRDGIRAHRLQVTAYHATGADLVERGSRMVELADQELRFPQWRDRLLLPNSGDHTFARAQVDRFAELASRVRSIADPQARAVVWATGFELSERGALDPGALVAIAADQLGDEPLAAIWEPCVQRLLGTTLPRLLGGAALADARAALAGLADRTGSPELRLPAARAAAACTSDGERLQRWLERSATETGQPIDAELRWLVLARLAELGVVDAGRIEAELSRDRSSVAETGAARALAARPTREAKEAAWQVLSADEVGNRVFTASLLGLWVPEQADLVAPYVERYLAEAPRWAARRGQGFSLSVGHGFPRHAVDEATRDALTRALDGEVPTVLRRVWDDRLDDLTADLAVRAVWTGPERPAQA